MELSDAVKYLERRYDEWMLTARIRYRQLPGWGEYAILYIRHPVRDYPGPGVDQPMVTIKTDD